MAMQVQRGLVKYKDRSDIVCTYGVTDNGGQYYFLDDTKLVNGNIVVTTALVEAVDPLANATHVGIINENGDLVVPCEYRSIKAISNDVLLAEIAEPISASVLECLNMKDDPEQATKFVTTPATIKDNINANMGEGGRFVFNDLFSEATIMDINGNNLINNEFYSFIGVDDNNIYFSKNVVGSEVVRYPLYPINEEVPVETHPELNIENTEVTTQDIENAINDQLSSLGTEEVVEEAPVEEDVYVEEATEEVIDAANAPVNEAANLAQAKVEEDDENITLDFGPSIPTDEEMEESSKMLFEEKVEEPVQEDVPESEEEVQEEKVEETDEEEIPLNIFDNSEKVEDKVEEKEEVVEEKQELKEDFVKAATRDDVVFGEDVDNDVFTAREARYVEDRYNYEYDDTGYSNLLESYDYGSSMSSLPQKNLFDDVTVTLSNLVELNRNLQAMIDDYDMKLAKCNASRKKYVELTKSQAREISSLNARIGRLESEKKMLESKLQALTPTSNGELVRVMADAQNILGQTRLKRNSSEY